MTTDANHAFAQRVFANLRRATAHLRHIDRMTNDEARSVIADMRQAQADLRALLPRTR